MNSTLKVLNRPIINCQDFPQDIRTAFFKYTEEHGNDYYLYWNMQEYFEYKKDNAIEQMVKDYGIDRFNVCSYLEYHGITEDLLIKHWW